MKHLLTLTFLALIGCSNQPTSTSGVGAETSVDTTNALTKEIVVFDTTFVSKSAEFHVITGRDKKHDVYTHIIKNATDTTTIVGASGGIEVADFNSDGFPDVILYYLSNHPLHDLYLFDSQTDNYRKVEGFNRVSDSKPVKGENNFYYSYQHAGCADLDWTSLLFQIVEFQVVELGEMDGFGCDREDQILGIVVYVLTPNEEAMDIAFLPIDTIEAYENYKWGFIADYWKTNLDEFVK